MCGISGYLGCKKNALQVVLEGISHLEYRGYDSAGVAAFIHHELKVKKQVGKVSALKEVINLDHWGSHLAIAHTRWATHGKPSDRNAHPQEDASNKLVVVHNGIIENFETLKASIEQKGIQFVSETDTEVIAQLIGLCYQGDLLKAVREAMESFTGAFAIAVLHKDHPDEMIVAAKDSPLCLGLADEETYVASDPAAFLNYTKQVIYLHGCEIAQIKPGKIDIFDFKLQLIEKPKQELAHKVEDLSKGQFPHFMLKEIFEQPHTLQRAMLSRFSESSATTFFEDLDLSKKKVDRIVILACGTSYHSGLIAAYMIEELARIPVSVEISSEFRYRNPILFDNTLVMAISQSGETADTLAAMRELKRKGAFVLGICNVHNSSLTREVDSTLFLRAGPEIGVASTKAFTSQLVVLSLLAIKLARARGMSFASGSALLAALQDLPDQTRAILKQRELIKQMAQDYARYENFFYLGRRYMYPTALEGALKLKEIAYVNANGYAAGEMKHGPISLIDADCPTVALMCDQLTFSKMNSNLCEVKAREGRILAIAPEGSSVKVADEVIYIPKTCDEFYPILTTIVTQLLAYEIAAARGCEIDQPRNLAKSVTVE